MNLIKVGDRVRSIRGYDSMPTGVTGVARMIRYSRDQPALGYQWADVFVALDPGQKLGGHGWTGKPGYNMNHTEKGWRFATSCLTKIDVSPFEQDLADYLKQELGDGPR